MVIKLHFGRKQRDQGCDECDCIEEIFQFQDDFCGVPFITSPTTENLVWQITQTTGALSPDTSRTDGWWIFTLPANGGNSGVNALSRLPCFAIPGPGQGTFHLRASVFMPSPLVAPAIFHIGLAAVFAVRFVYDPATSPFWRTLVDATFSETTVPVSQDCTNPDKLEIIATSKTIRFLINGQPVATIVTPASQLAAIHQLLISLSNIAALASTAQMEIDYVCVSKKRFCRLGGEQ